MYGVSYSFTCSKECLSRQVLQNFVLRKCVKQFHDAELLYCLALGRVSLSLRAGGCVLAGSILSLTLFEHVEPLDVDAAWELLLVILDVVFVELLLTDFSADDATRVLTSLDDSETDSPVFLNFGEFIVMALKESDVALLVRS